MKFFGIPLPKHWYIPFLGIVALLLLGIVLMAVLWTGGLITPADQSRLPVERDNPTLEQLTHAIELNPTYAEAYIKRGKLHLANNDYDAALADIDKALSFSPTDQPLQLLRAEIRQKRAAASQSAH